MQLLRLNNVLDIQTYLSCNGFEPGPLDGVRGNKTTRQLKVFNIQLACRLTELLDQQPNKQCVDIVQLHSLLKEVVGVTELD